MAAELVGATTAVGGPGEEVAESAAKGSAAGHDPSTTGRHASGTLTSETWSALSARCSLVHVSTSGALLAALALTVARWSGEAPTLADIDRRHSPGTDVAPGVTTSVTLPKLDWQQWGGFTHYATAVDQGLSDIGLSPAADSAVLVDLVEPIGDPDRAPSAASEVSLQLKHTHALDESGLRIDWHIAAGSPSDELLAGMFAAYLHLLGRLANDSDAWSSSVLGWDPGFHAATKLECTPFPGAGPHLDAPWRQASARSPQQPALVGTFTPVTHGELAERAAETAAALNAIGIGPGSLVAIAAAKGDAQIAAVLGISASGAGYVPIDPAWPAERIASVCAQAGIRHALATEDTTVTWPNYVRVRVLDRAGRLAATGRGPRTSSRVNPAPEELAYVIFTSGSTGVPKGVAIEHWTARNTVDDITDRFGVGAHDRVLSLSALSFDLSVYDIFGVLGAGGALVLPDAARAGDPEHWLETMQQHQVTIWNTAPALMEMLVEQAEAAPAVAEAALAHLRLVLLSGDWIPVSLPDRLRALAPQAEIVSLGGATEASIWSICFPIDKVDPNWASIPYGRALRGQSFHVLDEDGAPCPVGLPGELHIGGEGLAREYIGNPRETTARFINHPVMGERLYRTGDMGRWQPDGTIEFLGRVDRQVKIRGYRIELGEIDSVLNRHPSVRRCIAAAHRCPDGLLRLAAHIVPQARTSPPPPQQLTAALRAHLPAYMLPTRFVYTKAFPVTANGKVNYAALPNPFAAQTPPAGSATNRRTS
ncbi:amino acid adenylation domain-containing protein [Streptomyces vastus]|uniref:amino acid adenylation domain-containing protein n=1 Tax=Streptomyces vastus TaxID=285451 RepID=UPI0031DC8F28